MSRSFTALALIPILAAPLLAAAAPTPDDADWAAGRARLAHPDLKGRVGGPGVEVRYGGVARAEAQKMGAAVDTLVFGPLMATPALADPHGFGFRRTVVVAPPAQGLGAGAPATAQANLLALEIHRDEEQPDAAGTWRGSGEGPSVKVTVNDPSALFFYPDEDASGQHALPVAAATRDGFMVLRFSTRDHIVLTKPGKQPWRHVTKAEVLERRIAEARADAAKFPNPADAPILYENVRKLEAELAALSPAQRAERACRSGEFKYGTFTPCTVAGADYVVAYDPAYFDPRLPKTAIQLVVISEPADHRDDHRDLGPILRGAVRALDLKAIQAQLR
jgi:hypothetical protein